MTEMVEFFKLSYYSYRGGKKFHHNCSATCIYKTVFELKNILASNSNYFYLIQIELFQTQMIGVTRLWVDFVPLLANFHGFLDYGGKMQ